MSRNPESKNSNFIYQGFLAFLIFLSLYGCGPLKSTDTSSNVPIMQSEGEPIQLGKNLTLLVDPSLHLQVKTDEKQLELLLDYLNDDNEYNIAIKPKDSSKTIVELEYPEDPNGNPGNIANISILTNGDDLSHLPPKIVAALKLAQNGLNSKNPENDNDKLQKLFQKELEETQKGNKSTDRNDPVSFTKLNYDLN